VAARLDRDVYEWLQRYGKGYSRREAKRPRLTKLELRILEALWAHGKASVRGILETFPEPRPAYTTIQTTVYRMERKNAVRRVRKIGRDFRITRASFEKLAHNGLAGRGQVRRISHSFDVTPGGLCA
jgi:predicted transcriptional regulator